MRLEQNAFSADRLNRRHLRYLLTRAHANTFVAESDGATAGYVTVLFSRAIANARIYSIAVDGGSTEPRPRRSTAGCRRGSRTRQRLRQPCVWKCAPTTNPRYALYRCARLSSDRNRRRLLRGPRGGAAFRETARPRTRTASAARALLPPDAGVHLRTRGPDDGDEDADAGISHWIAHWKSNCGANPPPFS